MFLQFVVLIQATSLWLYWFSFISSTLLLFHQFYWGGYFPGGKNKDETKTEPIQSTEEVAELEPEIEETSRINYSYLQSEYKKYKEIASKLWNRN